MTHPTDTTNDELEAFVNGWLVEVAFGVYDREDLPKLADALIQAINQLIERREREAYKKGWVDAMLQESPPEDSNHAK